MSHLLIKSVMLMLQCEFKAGCAPQELDSMMLADFWGACMLLTWLHGHFGSCPLMSEYRISTLC